MGLAGGASKRRRSPDAVTGAEAVRRGGATPSLHRRASPHTDNERRWFALHNLSPSVSLRHNDHFHYCGIGRSPRQRKPQPETTTTTTTTATAATTAANNERAHCTRSHGTSLLASFRSRQAVASRTARRRGGALWFLRRRSCLVVDLSSSCLSSFCRAPHGAPVELHGRAARPSAPGFMDIADVHEISTGGACSAASSTASSAAPEPDASAIRRSSPVEREASQCAGPLLAHHRVSTPPPSTAEHRPTSPLSSSRSLQPPAKTR